MVRRIHWKLLITPLTLMSCALVLVWWGLSRQFEDVYAAQVKADLLRFARVVALHAREELTEVNHDGLGSFLRDASPAIGGPQVVITDPSGAIIGGQALPPSALGTPDTHRFIEPALRGEDVVGTYTPAGAPETVFAVVPIRASGEAQILGAVRASLSLSSLQAARRRIRWLVGGFSAVTLAVAGALGVMLARGITRPVEEMRVAAARLAAGHFGERVPVRARDELGELAGSFNRMADELQRAESTRRAFVEDAAHELRTPVANLAVALEALRSAVGGDPEQVQAIAADLEHEVRRLHELAERLLDLAMLESGHDRPTVAPLDAGELIDEALRPFRLRAARANVSLAAAVTPGLPLLCADVNRTVQALTDLLENALAATPEGGRVTVGASETKDYIILRVTDTGSGIPEADLPRVFDRFFRGDTARARGRGGAGLGLAIARRLLEAQGGILQVESVEGHGTRCTVALPMYREPPVLPTG